MDMQTPEMASKSSGSGNDRSCNNLRRHTSHQFLEVTTASASIPHQHCMEQPPGCRAAPNTHCTSASMWDQAAHQVLGAGRSAH